MKLQEIMNSITSLGQQMKAKNEEIQNMAAQDKVDLKALQSAQTEMDSMDQRMKALRSSYDFEKKNQEGMMNMNTQNVTPITQGNGIRKSNEYARAFAYAICNGINRKNGRGNENVKILFDALTEGGGEPVGTDGGFLVPEDIDQQIRELKRDFGPMAPLFGQENVTTPTGWRVVDTAPTRGMAKVEEMGNIGDGEEPAFKKVNFSVDKYAQIIPVSNELASDNVANLFAYLSRWFARKAVITENGLILAGMQTLTAEAIGTKPIQGLKSVLNKALDPAIARGAVIICNQDGFDLLDQLEDDHGRGLLQPDPTNATQYRILGHDVHVFANSQMTGKDIYIGDGKEFGTLFTRQGFEVTSTDIGGNAWKTDSIEVRGITRIGFTVFDKEAMARRSFGA